MKMKMNLKLNNNEGMKLLTAIKSVAAKYNRNPDSCDTMEEYGDVIEAALTAIGLNVRIERTTENEDFNDDEGDENVTYSLAAKRKFIRQYVDNGHTFEEACWIADILFGKMEGE